MKAAPHTSSRQCESHATGEVECPSAVTGRFWISRSSVMTFIIGCRGMSNSSHRGEMVGDSCRLIRTLTVADSDIATPYPFAAVPPAFSSVALQPKIILATDETRIKN